MNERIKELAEQSGLGFLYKDNWLCGTEIQHFAELVIQNYAEQLIPTAERWVGLTDEEVNKLCYRFMGQFDKVQFVYAVEAKLKEKNT